MPTGTTERSAGAHAGKRSAGRATARRGGRQPAARRCVAGQPRGPQRSEAETRTAAHRLLLPTLSARTGVHGGRSSPNAPLDAHGRGHLCRKYPHQVRCPLQDRWNGAPWVKRRQERSHRRRSGGGRRMPDVRRPAALPNAAGRLSRSRTRVSGGWVRASCGGWTL